MNNGSRNGVGCSAAETEGPTVTGTAEAEVLPPYVNNEPARVRFSRETMQNPCFWILVGGLGACAIGGIVYWIATNNGGKNR